MMWGKSVKEHGEWCETWHRWFAWYPVCLSSDNKDDWGRWVWWEYVERKPLSKVWDDIFIYRRPVEKTK